MIVKLSPKTKRELSNVLKDFGYRTEQEFVEDALRRRVLELKKIEFAAKAKKIREKLAKKGFREEDILKDFDKFYHRK